MKFLFKRLLALIPLFFGITLITFAVTQLAPGDITDAQTALDPKVSAEVKEAMRERYGLNRPVYERYVTWVVDIVRLDFGYSFKDSQPVLKKIGERLPVTLLINLSALILILVIAIPIGVMSAVKRGGWFDHVSTIVIFLMFSLPTFWLALMLMSFFGVKLHWLPVSGVHSLDYEYMNAAEKTWDVAKHLILPVAVSALTGLAGISRYMRTSMLEVLGQEYIKTAWSKGLAPSQIYFKHAFRNAVLPIITLLGLSIPGLLGGSVIFETVFSIPGLGKLMYDAVMSRDIPVYMAILTLGALLTLVGNLLADLAYRWADPRIRFEDAR